MLDRDSEYVKDYLNRAAFIATDILNEDYSNLKEYRMPDKYGTVTKGEWRFKILKTQNDLIKLKSENFNKFLSEPNIICVGINRFPPGTYIKEHTDPPCYGKNLWRILVPIQCEESYIKGKFGVQKCEVGNLYIIDLIYELHNGWNNSKDKDFVVCTIDILYENQSDYGIDTQMLKDKDYKKAVKIDLSLYDNVG
jgi:hypothetical protein